MKESEMTQVQRDRMQIVNIVREKGKDKFSDNEMNHLETLVSAFYKKYGRVLTMQEQMQQPDNQFYKYSKKIAEKKEKKQGFFKSLFKKEK